MRYLFCVALFLLAPASAHAITFAQLALGGGYECIVMITNQTAFAWSGELWVRQGYNQRWAGSWTINRTSMTGYDYMIFTLPPHATHKYRITGDGTTRSGNLIIEGDLGSYESDLSVAYFYEYRVNGVLQDTIGSPESVWGDTLIFPVEYTGTINTGFAWCPSNRYSSGEFSIILTLYDHNGRIYRQKIVAFTGQTAQFISQTFVGLPAGFIGSLKVEAQNYIHLEVLRMEYTPTGFQYTSTPAAWVY